MRRVGQDAEGTQRLLYFRAQLEKLCIAELAASNAHVHLAAPSDRLRDAVHVLDAWKAPYRSVLVCARPVVEFGSFWRPAQEFLIVGTKGNTVFRDNNLSSLIEAERNLFAHVAHEVRSLIEQVSSGPYLEVFGVTPCPGWTVVSGNEVYEEDDGQELQATSAEPAGHGCSGDHECPKT